MRLLTVKKVRVAEQKTGRKKQPLTAKEALQVRREKHERARGNKGGAPAERPRRREPAEEIDASPPPSSAEPRAPRSRRSKRREVEPQRSSPPPPPPAPAPRGVWARIKSFFGG